MDTPERVRRRIIVSSNFVRSFKISNMFDCFHQLGQFESKYNYLNTINSLNRRAWSKFLKNLMVTQVMAKYFQRPKLTKFKMNVRPMLPENYK